MPAGTPMPLRVSRSRVGLPAARSATGPTGWPASGPWPPARAPSPCRGRRRDRWRRPRSRCPAHQRRRSSSSPSSARPHRGSADRRRTSQRHAHGDQPGRRGSAVGVLEHGHEDVVDRRVVETSTTYSAPTVAVIRVVVGVVEHLDVARTPTGRPRPSCRAGRRSPRACRARRTRRRRRSPCRRGRPCPRVRAPLQGHGFVACVAARPPPPRSACVTAASGWAPVWVGEAAGDLIDRGRRGLRRSGRGGEGDGRRGHEGEREPEE